MGRIANQPKINDLVAAGQIMPVKPPTERPSLPAIPTQDPGSAIHFRGPLADDQWTQQDAQRQWHNKNIPQSRISPGQPAQSPQGGSAIFSQVGPVSAAASAAGLAAGQALTAVSALKATSFQGAWGSMVNYSQGASVDYLGLIYVSLTSGNLGNTPSSSPTWAATGNTSAFLGNWDNATNYVVGNQVIDPGDGGYYICLANNVNRQPSSFPSDWQLITAGNLNSYEGNFSISQAYTVGELVSYQGALWVAVANNTGQTPSLSSSFWSLLGSNSLFTGPWSSSTPYPQNSFVSENGNVYQALTANTNVDPATHPATWQNVGPASLDNLADGSAFQKVLASMVNLVPDSDIINPTVYWPGGGTPIQYETRYPSAPGCPAFFLPGTGTPSGFRFVYSRPMAVVPGTVYTLSGHINAISVTSGTPTWNIFDPTITTNYASAVQTTGVDGRVSVTFTVPAGVSQVVCLLDSSNCTIASGQNLFWFQPQLVTGSNAGAYISSSADYLSGTVLIDFGSSAHGNKNLGSIPDGTSTFGQTASGLSYRPLSNPLTGHDAGASATINVSAFTMRTSSKGDISENSGSITGLSYGTGYYVFFDDPTLAGGAVTYQASTTKGTALQGAGRFFVGSITTPLAGASDTLGNNDGGTGAQSGASLSILSTIQTPDPVLGGYGSVTPISGISGISNVGASAEKWSGYVPQSQAPPSAITLTVTSQVAITGAGTGQTTLSYSTDGGSTFTTIYNTFVNRALTTDVINIALPATPQKIVLFAQNSHTAGSGTCISTISNILLTVQI